MTKRTGKIRDYVIRCSRCGSKTDLEMVAHRNLEEKIVGWLFTCKACFKFIKGKNLSLATDDKEA